MPKSSRNSHTLLVWLRRLLNLMGLAVVVLAFWVRWHLEPACSDNDKYLVERVGILPYQIAESSGLITYTDSSFITHNDDDDASLYEVNRIGALIRKYPIAKVQTHDWECIASADSLLFVADIGNNLNKRRNLCIYVLSKNEPVVLDTIGFRYADQLQFPPLSADEMNFDCEAMIHYQGLFYFFSKNRFSTDFVNVYTLPADGNANVAQKACTLNMKGQVTDAALNKSLNELAILTYGKLYFFQWPLVGEVIKPKSCLNIYNGRQCEAITYVADDTLYFTNEQRGLYKIVRERR